MIQHLRLSVDSSRYDDDIVYRALRSLHQALIRNPENSGQFIVGKAMTAYLSASPEEDIVGTFNRIVELAGLLSTGSAFRYFGFEDDRPTFALDAVIHFVDWITSISESDEDYRRMALATNIVRLAEQTLETLHKSSLEDTASFKDLVGDYWKEKDAEVYCAVHGPDSLNAPIHVHVLRWCLILFKDQSISRRFRNLELPDDWWHSNHITDKSKALKKRPVKGATCNHDGLDSDTDSHSHYQTGPLWHHQNAIYCPQYFSLVTADDIEPKRVIANHCDISRNIDGTWGIG
ncbi:hypothetical protein MPER_04076, partial [Moniliophthora perniciosa FA553]